MVNFTSMGYAKVRAPDKLMRILMEFWETNKHKREPEAWATGNIYTNHWKSPTYLVNVEKEEDFEGAGDELKAAIWSAAKDGMEEWTGGVFHLRPSSLYGIRVYTEGAVLNPHVDRIPLVSSAIINVDQKVSEPWPLEVYDRFGNAGWSKYFSEAEQRPKCNVYASNGMLKDLEKMAELDPRLLHFEAANGYTPLQEAILEGHVEIVAYLLSQGVDVNKRSDEGEGASPLNIALNNLGADNEISILLASKGALNVESELEEEEEWAEENYEEEDEVDLPSEEL
ncbi:MAG: hypothetical protein SGILL_004778 [Bacillariaceae sp.]